MGALLLGLRRIALPFAASAMVACFALVLPAQSGDSSLAEAGFLRGKLLVATDQMTDPRFQKTVIFIVEHDADGAFGLIVNRPYVAGPIADLLAKLGVEDEAVSGRIMVHYGGPVEKDHGFILHTSDYVSDATLIVSREVAFTGQAEILRAIGAGKGPKRSLLAFGYSGWGAGQLEHEIALGAWIATDADMDLLFDTDYEGKWLRAFGAII